MACLRMYSMLWMLLQNVTCKNQSLTDSSRGVNFNEPASWATTFGRPCFNVLLSFGHSVFKRCVCVCACDLKVILLRAHFSRLVTWWKKSPLDLMRSSPFWYAVGWEGFQSAKSQSFLHALCAFCDFVQSCHFCWRPHFLYSVRNWQNFMLPGGQLLFTNSNLHRHFKAQISQAWSCLHAEEIECVHGFMCVPMLTSYSIIHPYSKPLIADVSPHTATHPYVVHVWKPRSWARNEICQKWRRLCDRTFLFHIPVEFQTLPKAVEKTSSTLWSAWPANQNVKRRPLLTVLFLKSFLNWIISNLWILFHLFLAKYHQILCISWSSQAIEMARRSKLKRQRLFWFRRMETLSKSATQTVGLCSRNTKRQQNCLKKKTERLQSRDALFCQVKSGLVCLVIRRTCRISSGLQCPPRIWTKRSHPSRTVLQRPDMCECRMLQTDHRRRRLKKLDQTNWNACSVHLTES